ncbi:MAG: DUF1104 domain-containing protein [Sulfurospirillaceae bacterium]|nr:DUF1104 domain-containing protein [Sulfurospirillaceae bacterium]
MKKIIMSLLVFGFLFAKADYSEMSTEELLASMGYVTPEKKELLYKELEKRVDKMSDEEKIIYFENLKKMKK